ncbi:hypothetical protein GIB67_021505 [Kingdonia uniflora]|uniref:Alpha-galactosidase n=1 Tax=Kingdonia uniflora TaxID=39325 RepID=A0A7J7L9I4_9MAGN|nr:hypothetical protein GIB67_021505 [Kingdonia uniflora]
MGRFTRPGRWNDPDMLEVGSGELSLKECRLCFSIWALIKHFDVSKNLRCGMTVYLDPLLLMVAAPSLNARPYHHRILVGNIVVKEIRKALALLCAKGYYMKQSEKIENDAGKFLDGEEEMRLGDKLWLILFSSMLICVCLHV